MFDSAEARRYRCVSGVSTRMDTDDSRDNYSERDPLLLAYRLTLQAAFDTHISWILNGSAKSSRVVPRVRSMPCGMRVGFRTN